ncbi:MAG: AF1514 family protein [Gammaproteobacteria bacterium]
MKTLRLGTAELGLDFNAALKLATAIAQQQWGDDTMLLSWYDRERDHGASPG